MDEEELGDNFGLRLVKAHSVKPSLSSQFWRVKKGTSKRHFVKAESGVKVNFSTIMWR
jgi:hypothetical protein